MSLVLLTMATTGGCGAETGDDELGTHAESIVNGQVDHGHLSEVPVKSMRADWSNRHMCTGTVIGWRTVLTAAHCLERGGVTFVKTGPGIGDLGWAKEVHIHPQYRGGNWFDIAVIILHRPVPGVTPSPIATNAPEAGQEIALVGFGVSAANSNDYGTRRIAHNTVVGVVSDRFSFRGDRMTCHGDSGGPAFSGSSPEVVIGVHATSNCTSLAWNLRTDYFASWIQQVAQGDVRTASARAAPSAPPSSAPAGLRDVYRLYNFQSNDHLLSLVPNEGVSGGYHPEGSAFRVFKAGGSTLERLYRCRIGADHFTSRRSDCEGQVKEGQYGYVATRATSGVATRPLYRCYHHRVGNHLTTTNRAECDNNGYVVEHVEGYVP